MFSIHISSNRRPRSDVRNMVSTIFFKPNNIKSLFFQIDSFGCAVGNKTEFLSSAGLTEEEFQERPIINWDAILWVNRPVELWGVQLLLALISLTEALLLTYLGYKVQPLNKHSIGSVANSKFFHRATYGSKFYPFILY